MREIDYSLRIDRRTFLKASGALGLAVALSGGFSPIEIFAAEKVYKPGEVVVRGDTSEKRIFLTVDDGNSPTLATQISEYARHNGVKLTFFPIGRNVAKYKEVWAQVLADGHALENHTWDHKNFKNLTKKQVTSEILRQEEAVKEAAQIAGFPDYQVVFVRAPGGAGRKTEKVISVCKNLNYVQAYWTIDSQGWRQKVDADMVYNRVVKKLGNGKIDLHHTIKDDADALPRIIDTILEKGYALDKTMRDGIKTSVFP